MARRGFRSDCPDQEVRRSRRSHRRRHAIDLGLASYAFTNSAAAQAKLSAELEVGVLAINNIAVSVAEAPFGGVKDSGYGYESGEEGIESYLRTKTIHRQV